MSLPIDKFCPGQALVAPVPTLLTTLPSDAHTWNLVFLQLFLEECGHRVVNLGATVPIELVERQARRLRPGLIVISTVNGHGVEDGMRVVRALRCLPELTTTTIVIGGKLGVDGPQGPTGENPAKYGWYLQLARLELPGSAGFGRGTIHSAVTSPITSSMCSQRGLRRSVGGTWALDRRAGSSSHRGPPIHLRGEAARTW